MLNLNSCIYLDNAATSRFKPRSVIHAIEKELKRPANPGRGGHKESLRALGIIEDARDKVFSLTKKPNVVFTKSCTEALNLAIFGAYKSGEILTSVYEHNSVLRPIERLRSRGAVVKFISTKNGVITPTDLKNHITKKTALVVLGEMSNVTGTIQPIETLGKEIKEFGIPFIVDIAQSAGHLKTNYKDVSFLCAPAHKGLHGMQGTGFLAYDRDLELTPLIYGGTGTDSLSLTQPTTPPEGFEAGTLNTAGIAGLQAAITYTDKHFDSINKKIKELSVLTLEELKKLKDVSIYSQAPNGVISFNVSTRSSTEVADILDHDYDISVRPGLHCAPLMHRYLGTIKQGTVRVSFGVNNKFSDVEALIDGIKKLVEG